MGAVGCSCALVLELMLLAKPLGWGWLIRWEPGALGNARAAFDVVEGMVGMVDAARRVPKPCHLLSHPCSLAGRATAFTLWGPEAVPASPHPKSPKGWKHCSGLCLVPVPQQGRMALSLC